MYRPREWARPRRTAASRSLSHHTGGLRSLCGCAGGRHGASLALPYRGGRCSCRVRHSGRLVSLVVEEEVIVIVIVIIIGLLVIDVCLFI